MIYIEKAFLKIWEVEQKEKYAQGKASTSDKQQDGSWKNSSWFIKFVGKGFAKSKNLNTGDRIEVTKGKLENIYNKEQNKSYCNFIVFDFERQNENFESNEEDCPF